MIHTDAQMSTFLVNETSGIYVLHVTVRRVTTAMASMQKSAAYRLRQNLPSADVQAFAISTYLNGPLSYPTIRDACGAWCEHVSVLEHIESRY